MVGVCGASATSSYPTETAYVFMVQSLLSSLKDVVHILPVSHIDASVVHDFLRKLIIKLEMTVFIAIAVLQTVTP